MALSLVLCALYIPTLARTPTFSDGPELVTAIWTLGVPHPTGYPLFVIVAHVFTRLLPLPIEPVLKVEIFNMCAGVGASLFTAAIARQAIWLREERKHARERKKGVALPPKGPLPRDVDIASLFAGFTLGFSHLLWQQVRIPEVYPLHVFLVSAAAYAWVRFEVTGREKYVVWSAVPMGLGLSHHVTMVYMLPAGGVYLFARQPSFYVRWLAWPFVKLGRFIRAKRKPDSPPLWARFRAEGSWAMPVACVIGAAPLLLYYYLIWANEHTTGVTWNDVKDLDQLYYHATGKQYSGFLGAGGWSDWIARIIRVPEIFDRQFMPAGTALFFVGLIAVYRRAWRLGVFLTGMILFNVGHGVYYAVGDYANYYLPAVVACSVLVGVGLAWLIGFFRHRKETARRFWILFEIGALGLTAGLSVLGYGLLTRRLPDVFAVGRGLVWGIPLTAIGLAGVVMAFVLRKRPHPRPWPVIAALGTLGGALGVTFVSASLSRAVEIGNQIDIGGSYGEELATGIPPGSVLLTQGDGFIFTMWYEHHVLGRGLGIATLDAGTLHAAWYRKYLTSHYPESCDPLSAAHVADPEAYEKKCGDFALRMARGDKSAWVNLGQRAPRQPGGPAEAQGPGPKVARGDDPQCTDRVYREANKDACKCWEYDKRKRQHGDTCVESFEEGGVVPRAPVEIAMERIIRAHIDERPVFERNVATFWVRDRKTNPRGWSGPAYQRISGEYALLSRGRYAQIVYSEDIAGVRGCAPELDPVKLRRTGAVKSHGDRDPPHRPYRPNPTPVLIHASYLTPLPEGSDDDASRLFFPGDAVYIRLHFFERNLFDATKEDRKGALLRHGIRACVFDPLGKRVGMGTTISGKEERIRLLETTKDLGAGTYTVQACSVGQLPDEASGPSPGEPPRAPDEPPPPPPDPKAPLFGDDLPCQSLFLEYTFQLATRGEP